MLKEEAEGVKRLKGQEELKGGVQGRAGRPSLRAWRGFKRSLGYCKNRQMECRGGLGGASPKAIRASHQV